MSVLRLIADAEGVSPETVAVIVLDGFSVQYRHHILEAKPDIVDGQIDEAATGLHPKDR